MPDLGVKIKDVILKNPIIIASGTPTYGSAMVKKCIQSEAAAFVTKTLCYTEWLRKQPRPRFHIEHPGAIDQEGYFSLYSTERFNPIPPEEYVKKMKAYVQEAHDFDVRVIASIAGTDVETWSKLAELVTENGADMIELNLQCPHVEKEQPTGMVAGRNPELCYSILELVRKWTSLPLIGKVVGEGVDPILVAQRMIAGGADAVVLTGRFQGLYLEIETEKPIYWGGMGGYGGPWQAPITRKWLVRASEANLQVPVIGGSGIDVFEDIISYILCGAKAVQVCTAIMVHGHKIIKRWLRQISGWMEAKGYNSISDFCGRSVNKIIAPSQIRGDIPYASRIDPEACRKCLKCLEACPYEAISVIETNLAIDPEKCDGCRLCVALCSEGAVEFYQK
ncbi:MAG: 4Fe-4S binding protein [Deltaproteobacteria bacterium]|nr:4Fe-4S binding protein [Deltaproteobacteria bacterium]